LEKKDISRKRVSIVNLLFNYANTLFYIVNGLVLVPIYLNHFSIATYGSYLSSGNIVGMLGFLDAGMNLVFTQKLSVSYVKKNLEDFTKILGAGFFISIILTALLILIALGLLPFISDWVKAEPSEYKNLQYAFLLSAVAAGLTISFQNISAVFQAWLKVQICGYANLISIIIGISSTLIGLKFGLGVVSIPLGFFMKSITGLIILVLSLINILRINKYPKIKIEKYYCLDLLKSSLPVLGGNISKSLINNCQLLIITSFINPASTAIFVITGKVYQVCGTFLAPIGSSIYSSVSQLVGEGNIQKTKESIIRVFILFTVFSAIILSSSLALNSAFISLWVGPDKYGGITLSMLLCINIFLSMRFNFIDINLYALGLFGKTVLYDQISAIMRILLIFTLINRIGFIAIPISEFLSITFLSGYLLNKLIIKKLNLNHKEAIQFIFSGTLVVSLSFILAFIWQFYFTNALNWKIFISQSILFFSITALTSIIITKDTRNILFNLINYNKLKRIQ